MKNRQATKGTLDLLLMVESLSDVLTALIETCREKGKFIAEFPGRRDEANRWIRNATRIEGQIPLLEE